MSNLFSLDSKFDVNSICQVNFNFDLLKQVIEVVVQSQKSLTKKVADLENNSRNKDKLIIK